MAALRVLVQYGGLVRLKDQHFRQITETVPDADVRIMATPEVTRDDVMAAEVIFGFPKKEWVVASPALRWLQLPSHGVDGWLSLRSDILLTTARGVFGIPIAEWAMAAMLMLTRNLHIYRDQQPGGLWQERSGAVELAGSTVGIVGMGDIGRELAVRAKAFGCRVLGTRRTSGGSVPGVDAILPLEEMLPQADFLVLAVPGTPETHGMITAERLAMLRRGAYLINVGRGNTIDEEALIAALRSGHLAGAALDVATVEPLPASSPLWKLEQVIISPHVSGHSSSSGNRRTAIFCENLRRYVAGEPLINQADRVAGY